MPTYHAPDHVRAGADMLVAAVREMLVGYIECAYFTDGNGQDAGDGFEPVNAQPLTTEAWTDAMQDIAGFLHGNIADLAATVAAGVTAMSLNTVQPWVYWRQHGEDFWLTRNGHGTGFWDRGYPDRIGGRLSAAARVYGTVHMRLDPDVDLAFFE